jgi:prephenate dehydrogenase
VTRVGIVGLGLIGGSLGLALRALPKPPEVVGLSRRPDGAAAALQRGAVDRGATDPSILAGCDIAVIATPVSAVPITLSWLESQVPPRCLITDVASVKRPVIEASRRLAEPGRFIGGHPVAGKAESGIDASEPTLFAGESWIFTPPDGRDLSPFDTLFELIRAIGARVVIMSAEAHDREMAYLSHLAFTVSAAFATTIADSADPQLGGPGYRGMTRLASGDAAMYDDILRENRQPVLDAIDRFARTVSEFRDRIERGDRVRELFSARSHAAV